MEWIRDEIGKKKKESEPTESRKGFQAARVFGG